MSASGYYGGVTIWVPLAPAGCLCVACAAGALCQHGAAGQQQQQQPASPSKRPMLCAGSLAGGQHAARPHVRLARYVEANQPPARNSSSGHSSGAAILAAAETAGGSRATLATLLQVMGAFLVAGFGNVGAGLILEHVQEWPVFLHVNELFILVPSLLGLKGNLEMTMAARLSTQANLGHMDNARELLKMAKGNLALVQCQATVVSFVVALFAAFVKSLTLGAGEAPAPELLADALSLQQASPALLLRLSANDSSTGAAAYLDASQQPAAAQAANQAAGFDWDNALILCASSILTANIACFLLGAVMILVIVGCHRVHIDPDNIAAPVAASLGDMTTAGLLAVVAHSIYHYSENQPKPYLALLITLLFLGLLPVWICVAKTNSYTASVLSKGWTPIVIAVFISSSGGFILEYGKSRFSRLPVFQPVINGVGGNLVAVQASRLSTSLHKLGKPGQLPINFKLLTGPLEIFLSRKNDINFNTARLLLLLSVPAHLLYFYVIRFVGAEDNGAPVSLIFLALYMLLAFLQVAILLFLAQNLVNLLWRCSIDPDNYSTPLLTATGDLLGCAFLLIVFITAYQFNDPYALTVV